MIETLTHETLAEHLESAFVVELEGHDPIELVLIEVFAHENSTRNQRIPFSVVFRGPAEPFLPQAIYPLQHASLGPLDIFLVPIGPTGDDAMRYEAVFT